MHCPRCGVYNIDRETCAGCNNPLDYFQSRVYAALCRIEAGRMLGQGLHVVEKIGAGPSGMVFKVRDIRRGRVCVLKFLTLESLYSDRSMRRFLKDVAKMVRFDHPNLVRLYEARDTDFGYVALLMELVEGQSLGDRLKSARRPARGEAIRIVTEVGQALDYAHKRGVLHRTLKPSNILLDAEGRAHVVDFGYPLTGSLVRQKTLEPYVAPELLEDPETGDQRADVYSLGRLTYQMLTGRPPSPVRETELPEELRPVILRAVAENLVNRYYSVEEFVRALAEASKPKAEPVRLQDLEVDLPPVDWARREACPRCRELQEAPVLKCKKCGFNADEDTRTLIEATKPQPEPEPEPVVEGVVPHPRTFTGHQGYVHSIAVSPDGKLVVSGSSDTMVKLWRLEDQKLLKVLSGRGGYVYSVAFTSDGARVVSGHMDGALRVWDVAGDGEKPQVLKGHEDRVYAVVCSRTTSLMCSAGMDGLVHVWDQRTLRELDRLMGHTERIYALAVSADGTRLASAGMDRTVRVWDLGKLKEVGRLVGHSDRVYALAFSPDGRRLVTGSMDMTLKVWELETMRETATMSGHAGYVYSVAVSADNRCAVSGGMDKAIKFWDLATRKEIRSIAGHDGSISCMGITREHLVTGSYDSTLRLWDLKAILACQEPVRLVPVD